MQELSRNGRRIFTVSELTRLISVLLEENFFFISVIGEVSNLRFRGNHAYFSLKDDRAVIKVVVFDLPGKRLNFDLKDGTQVICNGRLSLYEKRGEYQIIADKIELVGKGQIFLQIEQLKEKLKKEGLFDESLKREIPSFPWRIGIVTSPSGAAIRDILKMILGKGLGGEIVVYPSKVQGGIAHLQLIEGIRHLNNYDLDVIIISRGGGDIEDLMPFNDENLAREIRKSSIPIISAVGHEIDYTISDLVADLRAPTPTAAGEIIANLQIQFMSRFSELVERMGLAIRRRVSDNWNRFHFLGRRLLTYRNRIDMKIQEIDILEMRVINAMDRIVVEKKSRLEYFSRSLDNLSPLRVLGRGYSIITKKDTGEILFSPSQVRKGELLDVRLSEGGIEVEVKNIKDGADDS